jgi:hypothetical protein
MASAAMISSQTLAVSQQKEELEEEELAAEGVPVCGANYSSPVIEQTRFIDEVHYRIGNRLYIENAPHF